jgi:hypothetical protein
MKRAVSQKTILIRGRALVFNPRRTPLTFALADEKI